MPSDQDGPSSSQPQQRRSSSKSSHSSGALPPPIRPALVNAGSEHMLPTSTTHQSRNQHAFSAKHRLVKRDLPYFQSKNRLEMENQHNNWRLWRLLHRDWFHVILRWNLGISLLGLLGIWTLAILIWAAVYMRLDRIDHNLNCGLGDPPDPIEFASAFSFSLETCTTVG